MDTLIANETGKKTTRADTTHTRARIAAITITEKCAGRLIERK